MLSRTRRTVGSLLQSSTWSSIRAVYWRGLSTTPATRIAVQPLEKTRQLLHGVLNGNRADLAEAITLVESKHPDKHKQSEWLLTSLLEHRNKQTQSNNVKCTIRLGLSGSPGSGKSTLIESLGKMLTGMNQKVAVLAVDPSSSKTGGSILGDKTRMTRLATDPLAYIRPSPSGGNLGGVARNTQEAILLCEGAGYDVIIIETVGVGQSETAVHNMVDMFVLLVPPAAGDELQGLKKGIVELADIVVITKSDGDLKIPAKHIQSEYLSALKLIKTSRSAHWRPRVLRVSAIKNEGMDDLWDVIEEYIETMKENGQLDMLRTHQQKAWMWTHIEWELSQRFRLTPSMRVLIEDAERRVMASEVTPGSAAEWLIETFLSNTRT